MKKTAGIIAALLGVVAAFAAGPEALKSSSGAIHLADAVRGGDRAVRTLALALALENPRLNLKIEQLPPEKAFAMLKEGKTDLVLAAGRDIPAEYRRKAAYAIEPLLAAVPVANSLAGMTSAQLSAIFRGEKGEWREFNGSPFAIHRYAPEVGAPGEGAMFSRVLNGQEPAGSMFRAADSRELALLAGANPNSLALLAWLPPEKRAGVRLLPVDGVTPGVESIRSGNYPLAEVRYLVPGEKLSPDAGLLLLLICSRDFLPFLEENYLLSPR